MSEDNGIVRKLIIATITDTRFLKGLRQLWREEHVGLAWAWIAKKAFKYLDKYGEAPGKNIETLWQSDTQLDVETKTELEKLLEGLSEDWEAEQDPLNSRLLLEEAERYFGREVILTEIISIEDAAEAGDVTRAIELIESLRPPRLLETTSINPSLNPDLLKRAFESAPVPLVQLGGAFQDLVGSQIVRDSFSAFLGKEKVGKTWLLQSLAFSGLRARRRVLFAQCGDLSLSQQLIRLSIQLTGRNNREKYCGPQLLPVMDCLRNQDDSCQRTEREASGSIIDDASKKPYPTWIEYHPDLEYKPCTNCSYDFIPSSWWEQTRPVEPLKWEEAFESWQRFYRAMGDLFRLEWFPTRTANVNLLDAKLHQLRDEEGWVPDIVIVDYFDILANEPKSGGDFRHIENARWEAGRRFSQDWNCALITATQANRDSYKRRILTTSNTSEDKRKGSHVTAYFGLNKDVHDKRRGWMRINPLYARDDGIDEMDQVVVFQLIERGCPNLGSFWLKRINSGND